MNKGLEALERLMTNYYEMCQDLGNNDDEYQRCNLTSERATIEKELKALEIIKEKRVNVDNFLNRIKRHTTYKEYKMTLCERYRILVFSDKELTEEEYNLLKEVLL